MNSRKILTFILVLMLILCGCGRRISVFDRKMMLISSYDLTIEGTVQIHEVTGYTEQGMPENYVTTTEILLEGAEGTAARNITFTYNQGSGEIRTDGLFEIIDENGENKPVAQTLTYDSDGRLLSWYAPNMSSPQQYVYNEQGQLIQITEGNEVYETITEDAQAHRIQKTHFLIPGFLESNTQFDYQEDRLSGWTRHMDPLSESTDFVFQDIICSCQWQNGHLVGVRYDSDAGSHGYEDYTYNADGDLVSASIHRNGDLGDYYGDSKEVNEDWSFAYTYDKGRLLKETMSMYNADQNSEEITVSYEYDDHGQLTAITEKGENWSCRYTLTYRNVTDPVIRAFLLTKPAFLNGSYAGGLQISNTGIFVLGDFLVNGLQAHYCYQCGRLMLQFCETCPYCETAVNMTHVIKGEVWTLDGRILR